MALVSRLNSSGDFLIINTATFDEVTGLTGVLSRQYVNGYFMIANSGILDEVTIPNNSYSVLFGSSLGNYLSAGTSTTLALGAGDFTIETWVYPTAWNALTSCIWDYRTNGTIVSNTPCLFLSTSGVPQFSATAGTVLINGSSGLTLNSWNHLAVVRSGTTITMYLNGASVGTVTNSATFLNQTFAINNPQTGFNYAQAGYFSNFRIVKGTAVYTSAFSPLGPLSNITNTVLLTCQNSTIIDNGTANAGAGFSITNNGPSTTTNSVIPSFSIKRQQYSTGSYLIAGVFDEQTGIV